MIELTNFSSNELEQDKKEKLKEFLDLAIQLEEARTRFHELQWQLKQAEVEVIKSRTDDMPDTITVVLIRHGEQYAVQIPNHENYVELNHRIQVLGKIITIDLD